MNVRRLRAATFRMDGEQPSTDSISHAASLAFDVFSRLDYLRRGVENDFPDQTSLLITIDKVLQTLRDQHEGLLPNKLLSKWELKRCEEPNDSRIMSRPERDAMEKIVRKWSNGKAVVEEFGFLEPEESDYHLEFLPQELLPEKLRALQVWLLNQRIS